MNNNRSKRIFGLDLMRAVAISFVLVSHAMWIFPELNNRFVSSLRGLGYVGVEIFFVLSGFLIGRILYRIYTNPEFKAIDFRYFLIRRWFRTLPNYYLILLVNIPIWLFFDRPLPEKLNSYFLFLQNFYNRMPLFFTESWSLPIEEVTYILIPLLLWLLFLFFFRFNRRKLFLWTVLLMLGTFLFSKCFYHFYIYDADTYVWNRDLKAVVVYRIDAIIYGVLAAYLSKNYSFLWRHWRHSFFLGGLLLFGVIHLVIPLAGLSEAETPFYLNVLYLPLVSVSIAASLPLLSGPIHWPNWLSRPITQLSLISYSVYLLHYSIVLQLMRYLVAVESMGYYTRIAFMLLYFVVTLILSFVLYRVFERPVMDLRDHKKVKRFFGVGNF